MYPSVNKVRFSKSRRLRWVGPIARMEEGKRALKILTRKPIGTRPQGRPRHSWEDNVRNRRQYEELD